MISTALDAIPTPPCSQLLGWRVLDARPEDSWIRIGFEGKPEFRNPAGFIQGGILSAMLDDTMGPAVFVKTNGRLYTATISMNISFLAPAKVGPIIGSNSRSRNLLDVHGLSPAFMRSGGIEKVARDWRKTSQEGKIT